ncbi:MAG: NAD(P)-binding protein [Acidobacteriota bacterium]
MKSSEHYDIGVVGSGFAGSILARVLNKIGYRVVLLERGCHPRFALGESSTPLAALSLERLAHRYGLEDLRALAAWGRWKRDLPHLCCGLKRGFTFYRHFPGRPFEASLDNDCRLMVAASPDDSISDCQWLRADVDHFLVQLAEREGVAYFDRVELTRVDRSPASRWELVGSRHGGAFGTSCDIVVDATGRGGFVASALGVVDRGRAMPHRTRLVFGHFDRVEELSSVVEPLSRLSPGPYADEWAAVHHLLDEGWLYSLRFDDGRVSAGMSLHGDWRQRLACDESSPPEAIWSRILARYPTLDAQFGGARIVQPLSLIEAEQHRLDRSSGDSWVVLPHTYAFVDPIYSTGIAWSLLAVERLADVLEAERDQRSDQPIGSSIDFGPYSDLLQAESEQLIRLVAGA